MGGRRGSERREGGGARGKLAVGEVRGGESHVNRPATPHSPITIEPDFGSDSSEIRLFNVIFLILCFRFVIKMHVQKNFKKKAKPRSL